MNLLLAFIYVFLILSSCVDATASKRPDFVIVGAGTAGCAIAARLCTALPSSKIVLLERGFKRNDKAEFLVRSARKFSSTWESPMISEFFESMPNPGLFGRKVAIMTGNTLGGSSSINGMQWNIAHDDSVDRWGILGLSSRVAQKFYRRAYKKVGFARQPRSLRQIYADQYLDAGAKAGFQNSFAPFDSNITVSSMWQASFAATPTGRRIDSCTAYLTPAMQGRCRGNLKLLQGVTVTRVVLDKNKTTCDWCRVRVL